MTGNYYWVLPEVTNKHQDPQIGRAHSGSSQRICRHCCSCRPCRKRDEGRTVSFCCCFSHVTILRQWNGSKLCALRCFEVSEMKGCKFTFRGGKPYMKDLQGGLWLLKDTKSVNRGLVIRGIAGQRKLREEMKRENCDFIADVMKVAKERLNVIRH